MNEKAIGAIAVGLGLIGGAVLFLISPKKENPIIEEKEVDILDDSGVIDRAKAKSVPETEKPESEIENPTEEESENV